MKAIMKYPGSKVYGIGRESYENKDVSGIFEKDIRHRKPINFQNFKVFV